MRRFGQLSCLISLCALSCSQPAPLVNPPDWKTTSIELGQGQMQVGVRFRWVAERDGMGAVVRTPDGGEAQVRIFACGKPVGELMEILRQKLRWRLVGNEINRAGRAVTFRYWRGKANGGTQAGAALVMHGPLLISAASSTLEIADLVGIVERVRLVLPVAPLAGCLPLCDLEENRCAPAPEDEG
jgi:hypothetical protein